jgi:hypothetical protein
MQLTTDEYVALEAALLDAFTDYADLAGALRRKHSHTKDRAPPWRLRYPAVPPVLPVDAGSRPKRRRLS